MTAPIVEPAGRRPLRLWPGVVLVTLQWLVRFGLPVVSPEASLYAFLGGMAGGVLIVVWWLFFSRAPWSERLGAPALMVLAVAATPLVLHESVATVGMGMLFYILVVPGLSLAFVLWAAVSRRFSTGLRWAAMAAAIVLACGAWALVQTDGFDGYGNSEFAWRWSQTHEERLVAEDAGVPPVPAPAPAAAEPAPIPAAAIGEPPVAPAAESAAVAEAKPTESEPAAVAEAEPPAAEPVAVAGAEPPAAAADPGSDWPGFRGVRRDGIVPSVRIATDWSASPPVELWRRPVGPGWSSFAVRGGRVYTQEQRGEDEVVACYDAATGEPVWRHADPVRFWEANAGAGPRATPTLAAGRVYSLGATGILNALDAGSGAVVWSRDAAADTGAKLPIWGFSGSPLVLDGLVVVAVSGALAAYDVATGAPRWTGPAGGEGYSSPHLATIGGVEQIVQLNGAGAVGVAPADGALLWEHPWKGYPIVQPAVTAEGDVLISVTDQSGLRRLAVAHGPSGWSVEERWTSIGLKPYFNDFVVHEGHAYGFDGGILAAIDLVSGERRWKGGRYGYGQLVLLADQDLLLVLSETGELALVAASPDRFAELARRPAIEGKTWNHPVVAGDLLLVRNGREMVAFRLPAAGG